MEESNTNNYNFIVNGMNIMMDELYPRKEIFDLINFDGAKVVQVAGGLIEVDFPNLVCMLCTFYGGNKCFRYIGKLEFVNNLVRGSNPVCQDNNLATNTSSCDDGLVAILSS